MKLLVIWRLLTVGGVNAGWRNRAAYFKKHGIEVEFLYNKDHGGLHIMEDVAKVYLTTDRAEIISIINENDYDAIIVVDTGAAYGWIAASNYQGPLIVEARTPELLKLKPHVRNFRGLSPTVLVTPSHFERRVASILVDALPSQVIYNGIDTNFFGPLTDDQIDLESEPKLSPGKKVIGWIGRLDKRKNWRMLIEVATLIRREREDIEFWIIGGAQSVERDVFQQVWGEDGLQDLIRWFPVVPYQQMPHVYAKIRQSGGCTLATTRAESFGNTFIESMACGVPVIAPKVSSVPEIIVHGRTGYLYRDGHVRGAAKQIYRLLDNNRRYTRMSRAVIKHVEDNFSIPITGDRYIQLLKSLVYQRVREGEALAHD